MSQKIVINDCPDIYVALDESIAEMESQGLGDVATDVPVCVILKSTGEVRDGLRVFTAMSYIGASDSEIIDDLEGI
jgi:hypothetical protein